MTYLTLLMYVVITPNLQMPSSTIPSFLPEQSSWWTHAAPSHPSAKSAAWQHHMGAVISATMLRHLQSQCRLHSLGLCCLKPKPDSSAQDTFVIAISSWTAYHHENEAMLTSSFLSMQNWHQAMDLVFVASGLQKYVFMYVVKMRSLAAARGDLTGL